MLRLRIGPPITALGEGRAGVIWVLLLATPALKRSLSFGEGTLMFPISRALVGAGAGVVLDRSRPADLGPSATSVTRVKKKIFSLRKSRFTYSSGASLVEPWHFEEDYLVMLNPSLDDPGRDLQVKFPLSDAQRQKTQCPRRLGHSKRRVSMMRSGNNYQFDTLRTYRLPHIISCY